MCKVPWVLPPMLFFKLWTTASLLQVCHHSQASTLSISWCYGAQSGLGLSIKGGIQSAFCSHKGEGSFWQFPPSCYGFPCWMHPCFEGSLDFQDMLLKDSKREKERKKPTPWTEARKAHPTAPVLALVQLPYNCGPKLLCVILSTTVWSQWNAPFQFIQQSTWHSPIHYPCMFHYKTSSFSFWSEKGSSFSDSLEKYSK